MIDIKVDNHIHTRLCQHACGEMEDYVRSALKKGIRGICFLEHMESGINYSHETWLRDEDFDYYFQEGERLQRKYKNQLFIGLGVEVGYNPSHTSELLERLNKRRWDHIGISYHYYLPPGASAHLNLVSRKKANTDALSKLPPEEILAHYFQTLKEAVVTLPGTFLCHLDAALRFIPNLLFTPYHVNQIDELLDCLKQKGMALEINTSGIPIRNTPFPKKEIITLALAKGIPLIAGSDAHKPEDVGRFFQKLRSMHL